MTRHRATFEIDEKTDSYAASRILERVYDTVREESRTVREGTDDATALLAEFESLRDAVDHSRPGTLTVTYERSDGEFDD